MNIEDHAWELLPYVKPIRIGVRSEYMRTEVPVFFVSEFVFSPKKLVITTTTVSQTNIRSHDNLLVDAPNK